MSPASNCQLMKDNSNLYITHSEMSLQYLIFYIFIIIDPDGRKLDCGILHLHLDFGRNDFHYPCIQTLLNRYRIEPSRILGGDVEIPIGHELFKIGEDDANDLSWE